MTVAKKAEDVREAAKAALDAYRLASGAGLLVGIENQVGAVATGILAERERCAKVVEGYYDSVPDELRDAQDMVLVNAQKSIVSSIRSGAKP